MVAWSACFRRRLAGLALAALSALGAATPSAAASLQNVRVGAHGDFTRVVLDTSTSLAPDIARPHPRALVLDLAAAATPGLGSAAEGLVETVAVAETKDGTRLTLELERPARVAKAFALAPGDGRWHRYVVDLEADPAAETAAPPAPVDPAPRAVRTRAAPLRVTVPVPTEVLPERRPTPAVASPRRRPEAVRHVPRRRPERPVVVVDAGHGGRDPGAIGANGLREKDVTLDVARTLARRLYDDARVQVVLTRDDDTGLPLGERLAIAAAHEADLFLSLHADSLPAHPSVRGASVYTLSVQPSDPEAARKARKENAADERLRIIASAPDETVRTILTSLMRDSTSRRSAQLARAVAADLAAVTPLLQRPHRSANFVVLRSLNTPSVLVELGYLSNEADAEALADRAHRDALAAALFRAVTAYVERG